VKSTDINEKPTPSLYLFVFLVCWLLWLLLAGAAGQQEVLAGAAVAIVVTLSAAPRLGLFGGLRFAPAAPLHLLRYLGYFFVALLRANLDMARRVLSPSLPLRPAVVEIRTDLRSSLGKLLLANSITLTPGTLSVDVHDSTLLVHWVDCPPGTDIEQATWHIAAGFEQRLKGFLI